MHFISIRCLFFFSDVISYKSNNINDDEDISLINYGFYNNHRIKPSGNLEIL